jgi:hypothetical protein
MCQLHLGSLLDMRGGMKRLSELESKVSMNSLSARTRPLVRRLATTTDDILAGQSQVYKVFDRNAKRMQKDRAAAREGGERSRKVDYLFDEVANRLAERLTVGIKNRI